MFAPVFALCLDNGLFENNMISICIYFIFTPFIQFLQLVNISTFDDFIRKLFVKTKATGRVQFPLRRIAKKLIFGNPFSSLKVYVESFRLQVLTLFFTHSRIMFTSDLFIYKQLRRSFVPFILLSKLASYWFFEYIFSQS